jgi:triphosphoribosyl-dephospho-CoA synthase
MIPACFSKAGWQPRRQLRRGAASILEAGGGATPEGWRLFQHLDRDVVALKSSPRGSADMLAATIFTDYVSKRPATQK